MQALKGLFGLNKLYILLITIATLSFTVAIYLYNYSNEIHEIVIEEGYLVTVENSGVEGDKKGPKIVASKNGKRYYFEHCSGAKKIKEANKIWFFSENEAKSRGLTLASGCS